MNYNNGIDTNKLIKDMKESYYEKEDEGMGQRFELSYYNYDRTVDIHDNYNGGIKTVLATVDCIVDAIRTTYENDMYMSSKEDRVSYANKMISLYHIRKVVENWLKGVME
jgi:hypothetical protein